MENISGQSLKGKKFTLNPVKKEIIANINRNTEENIKTKFEMNLR
jgi:hypothetical protein